jgi:hypothetical protein
MRRTQYRRMRYRSEGKYGTGSSGIRFRRGLDRRRGWLGGGRGVTVGATLDALRRHSGSCFAAVPGAGQLLISLHRTVGQTVRDVSPADCPPHLWISQGTVSP